MKTLNFNMWLVSTEQWSCMWYIILIYFYVLWIKRTRYLDHKKILSQFEKCFTQQVSYQGYVLTYYIDFYPTWKKCKNNFYHNILNWKTYLKMIDCIFSIRHLNSYTYIPKNVCALHFAELFFHSNILYSIQKFDGYMYSWIISAFENYCCSIIALV